MNPRMLESNSHVVKRPLFASGVHADCHRCARTKRSQQQIVRRSAGIFASGRNRFIGRYSMPANADLLSEAVSASTDHNPVFHNHVVLLGGANANRTEFHSRSSAIFKARLLNQVGTAAVLANDSVDLFQ